MRQISPPRHADLMIAAAAAVGFASKGIFAKLLYARGWDFESVLTLRSLGALPIVWIWAVWRAGPTAVCRIPLAAATGAAGAGALCYCAGVLMNFYALTLMTASIERVLLFSYPSMVVILHALIQRRAPSRRVMAAVALTYAGILVVVGGPNLATLHENAFGGGLVLSCALTFALYYLASERWTPAIGSAPFTVIALTSATLLLVGISVAHHGHLSTLRGGVPDALLMAGLILFATVLPMLLMTEGVRRLGAQRAALISTIGPPTTLLMGALFLGERLSPVQCLGALLILGGIAVLQTQRSANA